MCAISIVLSPSTLGPTAASMLMIKFLLVIGTLLSIGVLGLSAYLDRQAAADKIAAARNIPMPVGKPHAIRTPVAIRKSEEDEPVIVPKAKDAKARGDVKPRNYRD